MDTSGLKKNPLFWKVAGVAGLTLVTLVAAHLPYPPLQPHHKLILVTGFAGVLFLCGWMIHDSWNLIQDQKEKIERLMGIQRVLTHLIDLKDPYTEGHSRHVRNLARGFAEFLNLPDKDVEEIALAAELHDIGKIGIRDQILKKNGKLDPSEYTEMQNHSWRGAESLQPLKGFQTIADIIRHHHERYDGTGYPNGLSGKAIPLGSRILSLVDTYDAMVRARPYRGALTRDQVVQTLESGSRSQFDPELTSAFIRFLRQKTEVHRFDPVCGMPVDFQKGSFQTTHRNQPYTFCSQTCLEEFERHPDKYVAFLKEDERSC